MPTEITSTSEQTRGEKVDSPVDAAVLNGRFCLAEVVAVTQTDNWRESAPVNPASVTGHAKQQLDRSRGGVAVFFELDAGVTVKIFSMPDSWESDAPLNQLLRRRGISPTSLDTIIGETYPLVYDRYRWVLESEKRDQAQEPFYRESASKYLTMTALTLLTIPVWFVAGVIPGLAVTSAAVMILCLLLVQGYQLDSYHGGDAQ